MPRSPGDDVDPELVTLSRPPPRLGLVFVACVLFLCSYAVFTLWPDMMFSLQDNEPTAIESPRALTSDRLGSFVKVPAVPDRSAPIHIEGDKDSGYRLVPLMTTSGRVWLRVTGKSFFADPHEDEVYRGRLRRLDDLAYADQLRAVTRDNPVPWVVRPEAVTGADQVTTATGDSIQVAPSAPVTVRERVRGEVIVTFAPTDRLTSRDDAQAVLDEAGLALMEGASPEAAYPDAWTFAVKAPDGADEVRAALSQAGYFGVEVTTRSQEHEGIWSQLRRGATSVTLGETSIDLEDIESIVVMAHRDIPAEALVLVTEEIPEEYWWVAVLCLILGGIALFMFWTLVRIVRN